MEVTLKKPTPTPSSSKSQKTTKKTPPAKSSAQKKKENKPPPAALLAASSDSESGMKTPRSTRRQTRGANVRKSKFITGGTFLKRLS